MDLTFCAPCLFGVEGILANELKRLSMKQVRAENGRVFFSGDETDLARANVSLRCAERVLVWVGGFMARTFDELFEGVKALPWENYIPEGGVFPVKGYSLSSALHSVPDCQSIVKKAAATRLGDKYHTQWMPETGVKFQIQFSLMKDRADLFIDTSGAGLHKRGYRAVGNEAPLRETLAAAMVYLSRFRGREAFCDPFCGSGTIPIEAALIARNRAPGLNREFDAKYWPLVPENAWSMAAEEAKDREFGGAYDIAGSDINPASIDIARSNAVKAGVSDIVRFERADASAFHSDSGRGVIVTNPPYGERLLSADAAEKLYHDFGAAVRSLPGWKVYILSSHAGFEEHFGRGADKKRKLYNGMIKCNLFMYTGE